MQFHFDRIYIENTESVMVLVIIQSEVEMLSPRFTLIFANVIRKISLHFPPNFTAR